MQTIRAERRKAATAFSGLILVRTGEKRLIAEV
jgi:hypothetical protein